MTVETLICTLCDWPFDRRASTEKKANDKETHKHKFRKQIVNNHPVWNYQVVEKITSKPVSIFCAVQLISHYFLCVLSFSLYFLLLFFAAGGNQHSLWMGNFFLYFSFGAIKTLLTKTKCSNWNLNQCTRFKRVLSQYWGFWSKLKKR